MVSTGSGAGGLKSTTNNLRRTQNGKDNNQACRGTTEKKRTAKQGRQVKRAMRKADKADRIEAWKTYKGEVDLSSDARD